MTRRTILPLFLLLAGFFSAEGAVSLDSIRASYEKSLRIATTNMSLAFNTALVNVIIPLNDRRVFPGDESDQLAAQIDAKYAEIGLTAPGSWSTTSKTRFPKSARLSFGLSGTETNAPYLVALARQKDYYCTVIDLIRTGLTIEELVGLFNENISLLNGRCRQCYSYKTVDMLRKEILARSGKIVKKYLRSHGKSFVTSNGVNPCESLVLDLHKALHAPRFEGVNEWLLQMGIQASIDDSHLPSSADVASLKDRILNADCDLNENNMFILKICLGVDGYNAFVKEYNGEN